MLYLFREGVVNELLPSSGSKRDARAEMGLRVCNVAMTMRGSVYAKVEWNSEGVYAGPNGGQCLAGKESTVGWQASVILQQQNLAKKESQVPFRTQRGVWGGLDNLL